MNPFILGRYVPMLEPVLPPSLPTPYSVSLWQFFGPNIGAGLTAQHARGQHPNIGAGPFPPTSYNLFCFEVSVEVGRGPVLPPSMPTSYNLCWFTC